MAPSRALTLTAGLAGAVLVLSACGGSSPDVESSAAAPSPAPSTASSPAATGAPSAELVTWAGAVCDDTATLRDAVGGIATAVVSGGTDIGASLQGQMGTIQQEAVALVSTVQSIPADGSSPEATALKSSADAAQASVTALGDALTELASADGLGAVTALPGVVSAANDAVGALGDTVSAIQTALAGGTSTLGQAFAASPSCAALQQG